MGFYIYGYFDTLNDGFRGNQVWGFSFMAITLYFRAGSERIGYGVFLIMLISIHLGQISGESKGFPITGTGFAIHCCFDPF